MKKGIGGCGKGSEVKEGREEGKSSNGFHTHGPPLLSAKYRDVEGWYAKRSRTLTRFKKPRGG